MQNNRCCCGKYADCELPFTSNGIEHEQLGIDGAFCGPVVKHQLSRAELKLNKISTVVNAALLTTAKRMNQGPEVSVSGSRFIEAKSLEDVLGHIAELLVA
jgi:hypothetical protein